MTEFEKIDILPLKKKNEKEYTPPETHPDIPQLHFTMCVVGPRNRGKSLLIRNLITRNDLLKKTFKAPNYIIIISPNIDVNGDFDDVEGKNVFKYESYEPELIKFLIQRQSEIIKTKGRKKAAEIIIILDDVLDSGALDYHSQIEKIFSRGRHVNINCILVSQHLNRISRTMRLNNDYFVMFSPNNETELDDFLEQYVSKTKRALMREYLKKMWAESIYNFILVDFKTKDPSRKFRKGFSEPIILT
jgi:hypothetical protein